ncbi:MAG: penicillin-binding protein 2, partial [Ferruginibacter sp.]|nr:penicillin-binding protein 2 [Ferruginibacter sp.]
MDVKKDILWRVYLSFLIMIMLGFVIIVKAFYTQNVEGRYWRAKGDTNHVKYMPINPERGTIYSEDGSILSTSVPVFDIFIDFGADGLREKNGKLFFEKLDSLSSLLSDVFKDKTPETYKADLQKGYDKKNRYYLLKRNISFDQYKTLNSFQLIKSGPNKSGFIFDPKDKRINPFNLMAKRTIGISRLDSSKNVGLENSYDSILRGIPGKRLVRYTGGVYLPVPGGEIDPVNGKDIVTTLDTYIQDVTEKELMKMIVDNKSKHGTAIVMETATGKIKAIANLGVDSNGVISEDYNYGVEKATEPGSVFKLVTLLSLLEDKHVDVNTMVDCEGGVKSYYGLRIRDSHGNYHSISVKEAFAESSNVAFSKLAFQYYQNQPDKWIDHITKFRLNQPTGIDLETKPNYLIKTPKSKSWSSTTIPYMAHGYEELVTPLHMLVLYNAVANNGKMMRPYLVSAIKEHDQIIRKIEPQV